MDLQAGLRARLLADSAVAAIVGARIYWVDRPQETTYPAITLQTISDPRPEHLKGFDGARATRVQVDCWAKGAAGYGVALSLARAVIAAISPPATVSGKRFGRGSVEGQRDLGETVTDGSFVHRQSVDFSIWHVGD